jgi:hypothetical protein
MRSVHDIVCTINEGLTLKDATLYGIARTVLRTNNNNEDERLPMVIKRGHEGLDVSPDDRSGIIL